MSRPWRRWTLHRQVLLISAFVLVILVTVGVVATARALDAILYDAASDGARNQADEVVLLVGSGDLSPQQAIREVAGSSLVQLLDDRGRVVVASSAAASQPLTAVLGSPGSVHEERVDSLPDAALDDPYAIVVGWLPEGPGYTLVVARPLDIQASTVRTTTALLGGFALLLVSASLVLISVIVRSALRPVEEIRSEVDRIREAGSGDRVTVPQTGDEIARLATTMNQMLDRLERADRATRRFVSDASHELRSPLTTIIAATELDDPELLVGSQQLAHSEGLRMQHLVDDLLTLAKADDDGLWMTMADVDLDDVADAEVRRLRATSGRRVLATLDAARVTGDALRLTQVVRNLADNASRHAASTVRLTVTTDGSDPDGRVAVVRVDNDGPVIPEAQREEVFARFARLHAARERDAGGSGLGLAIARTIVERHGGTLTAGVADDGWCRFEMRLPLG